ncbi:hypothetical protein [Pseudonocardia sp. T1-2H]|uniref:hypothetical protein n=1 Tax=Pseudonocardia sp. T1-2H TaxID=3128899 RepID=UPI003100DE08
MPTSRTDRSRGRRVAWRPRAAAVAPVVLAALLGGEGTAAAATPADLPAARVAAALGDQVGAGAAALRVVLLAATAVLAGVGLVWGLRGVSRRGGPERPARSLLVTGWAAAAVVTVAAEVAHLTGSVEVLGTLGHVLLALLVPASLSSRRVAVPGALLTVLLAVQLGSARAGWAFALDAVYAVGAVLLAGATVVALATDPASGPRRVAPGPASRAAAGEALTAPLRGAAEGGERDARPAAGSPAGRAPVSLAIGSGLVTALAGLAQLVATGPVTGTELVGTGYGLAGLAAVLLPAAAAVVWAVAALPAGLPRARELHRLAGIGTVVGVAAAAVLAALPAPGPAAVAGQPLLRAVDLAGQRLALLVTPLRPGPNLVHVSGTYPAEGDAAPVATAAPTHHGHAGTGVPSAAGVTVGAGGQVVPVTSRPGASGGWAVVDLPAGATSLAVSGGDATTSVAIDVGEGPAAQRDSLTGPDGPECAAAVLGGLVGDGTSDLAAPGSCPSDALDPADAGALTILVRTLAEHGVRTATLAADGSPRSVAAADLVRAEGAARGVTFVEGPDKDSALIVLSGWAAASDTLTGAGRRALDTATYLGGTYLAPWLLTGGVVTAASSSVVPLTFGPQDAPPQRYAATLAATFPGDTPSTSGYLAWARASGTPLDTRQILYGAAPVDVPMSAGPRDEMGGMHHSSNPAAWFPGGTVVPISAPLDPS